MREKMIFTITAALFAVCASAQINMESIEADIESARGILLPYSPGILSDTKAPAGYRPFYISHYGRHGSRYHCDIDRLLPAADGLEAASAAGLLSRDGMQLKIYVDSLLACSDGMWGELTDLGAREHREIAGRMYRRFPKVWTSGKRREVHCVSSDISRCIVSMANSTLALAAMNPSLEFRCEAGLRHRRYLADPGPDTVYLIRNEYMAAALRRDLDYSAFFAKIFTCPAEAEQIIPDPYKFCFRIFDIWAEGAAMQDCSFDIRDYMSADEILPIARVYSTDMYYGHMRGAETGHLRLPASRRLLHVIVGDADSALKDGSRVAADLRYGHDTGLLALEALIGLEGYDGEYSYEEAADYICMSKIQPKASNLQIVFYARGGSCSDDDCLVKFLVNEQETIIPALQPLTGPYYSWPQLKAYLLSL